MWNKVKETNEVLGNNYKLLGNAFYGKTVCKDNEDMMLFVTEGELKKHYYDNNLINYEKVFND